MSEYNIYSEMTQADFDKHFDVLLDDLSAAELLSIPGVVELVREHYNNEVLEMWEAERPDYDFDSFEEVREAFWDENSEFADEFVEGKTQNEYRTDIRVAFVDWVDSLSRDGRISEGLASEVTL